MTDNRRYIHFVIFAFILIVGLGFGLSLPWLANAQGFAAQSEAGAQDLRPEAIRYYVAITGTGLTWDELDRCLHQRAGRPGCSDSRR